MEKKNANDHTFLCYNNNKVKQVWDSCEGDDYHDEFYYVNNEGLMMMAWPPRSYTCSFCKREFRSAQALGGHMNVHRRDRAHLRQFSQISSNPTSSTTRLNLNLPPKPYSMLLSSPMSLPQKPACFAKNIRYMSSSTTSCTSSSHQVVRPPHQLHVKTPPSNLIISSHKAASPKCPQAFTVGLDLNQNEDGNPKKTTLIRLGLAMNVNAADGVTKENLDLELRLGYS